MAKLPFIQFYVADWEADTCELSLAARGLWHTLLMRMHQKNQSGILEGTAIELARSAHCFPVEFSKVLAELEAKQICEVRRGNGRVTVVNRRMKREADEREAQRIRQLRRRHAGEAEDVTPLKREKCGPEAAYAGARALAREAEEEDISHKSEIINPVVAEEERKPPSSPRADEEQWFRELGENPAYEGMDIRRIYWKMVQWCKDNGKHPTRRRFTNWLNREDVPIKLQPGGENGSNRRETASERNVRNIKASMERVEQRIREAQGDQPDSSEKPAGLLTPVPRSRRV